MSRSPGSGYPGKYSRRSLTVAGTLVVVTLLVIAIGGLYLVSQRAVSQASPWWQNHAAIQRGAHDVATGSCISCHTLAGVADSTSASDLTHEGAHRSVPWLLHELAHPTSQRPPIPPNQIHDIAAYLASLH